MKTFSALEITLALSHMMILELLLVSQILTTLSSPSGGALQ